uniref:Uncharacterized protein n=1 Tax=Strigamia maritima TaxID=126957 RepID=T1IRU3_STRMM
MMYVCIRRCVGWWHNGSFQSNVFSFCSSSVSWWCWRRRRRASRSRGWSEFKVEVCS